MVLQQVHVRTFAAVWHVVTDRALLCLLFVRCKAGGAIPEPVRPGATAAVAAGLYTRLQLGSGKRKHLSLTKLFNVSKLPGQVSSLQADLGLPVHRACHEAADMKPGT